jgi:hypothetical protein
MQYMRAFLKNSLIILALLAGTTACYRMPAEDEFSVIPLTNNPDINGVGGAEDMNPVPGLSY